MANGQINKLLEFANMQMAAEAFLSRADSAIPNQPRADQIVADLSTGTSEENLHGVRILDEGRECIKSTRGPARCSPVARTGAPG